MASLTSNNILARYAIPDLCGKNFFIPDYQRGYRWGRVQVEQLLEDLCRFFYGKENQGDFYCLQPVVVKELSADEVHTLNLRSNLDNNHWYEVVDGQQRLTTIRIFLALFASFDDAFELSFNIYYRTRPGLGQLFSQLKHHQRDDKQYDVSLGNEDNLDIDAWHIWQAANLILQWFDRPDHIGFDRDINISTFKKIFSEDFIQPKSSKKSVQIIWYELRDGSQPMDMFKRLNDKKVSLNNAELVRAMFLSDSAVYPCDEELLRRFSKESRQAVKQREKVRKQGHIIEQWDLIEHQLQQPSFWSFIIQDITNTEDPKLKTYDCRIEYLFDLITRRKADESDYLYTYITMEKMVAQGQKADLWSLWLKVEHHFSILRAWYEDEEYFHHIGFLTTELGATVLADLLEDATRMPKTKFKEEIKDRIYDAIHDNRKEGKILQYNYMDNYKLLKRVLFLFNVETSLKSKERFDFERYKQNDWTLEHIHAQNSERIDHSQKDKWSVWFDENQRALNNLKMRMGEEQHFTEIYSAFSLEKRKFESNRVKYSFEDLSLIFDKVLTYFNGLIKTEDGIPTMTHDISNMALLSREINSSVSNSVFEVKRQRIKQLDADGVYLPPCTRNVFLKYYNKAETNFCVQQEFYWSEQDRTHYVKAIKEVLQPYIQREGGQEHE